MDSTAVRPGAASGKRRRSGPLAWVSRDGLSSLFFLLPLLLIFGAFSWFPIVRSFVMAVQQTNLVSTPTFVGLDNFANVLADPLFGKAVGNTVYFAILALVIGYPMPLVLAVIMSETRRFRGLYSALAYLPVVVPPVVAVLLWKVFYRGGTNGAFNSILHIVGLGPVQWLGDAAMAMPSIVVEATWAAFGGTVIIYLAALAERPAGALRRGRGRRGLIWQKIRLRDPAAHARDPVHHADPAADRDGPGLHRAIPAHRGRPGQLDHDGPPAHLQLRLREQPGRPLR